MAYPYPSRRWVLVAIVAVGVVPMGGWAARRWWADPWPVRVEFGDAWPLGFTPDGRSFALAGPGGIVVRDCGTGQVRASWDVPGTRTTRAVVAGAFAPDGRTYAAAIRRNGSPAEVALIDVASGRIRATGAARFPQVYEFAFTPDGTALRMGTADTAGFRELASFDPATGATQFRRNPAPPRPAIGVASSPDGGYLAYLDAAGGPACLHATGPGAGRPAPAAIGLASAGASGAVAFAPDNRTLAIGRLDGTIDLWDIPGRRRAGTLRATARGYALSIVLSPDGRTIAANLGNDRGFDLARACRKVFDSLVGAGFGREPTGSVVLDRATGAALVRSADVAVRGFAPDGRAVSTVGPDGRVQVRAVPGR